MSLTRRFKLSIVASMLLLGACQPWTPTTSIPSPNGDFRATVVEADGGGATVGTSYRVLLNSLAHPFRRSKMGPEVWKSYQVEVKYVFWRDDKTLEVVVPKSRQDYLDTIRVRSIEGVTVVTTVLNGTSKQEVFEAVPIEVQTESAVPGQ
jgi:hypothetical protein